MAQRHNGLHTGTALRRADQVLVGREREQVFLREEWSAARGGQGRLVLFGGEAGIGKTTLARDLARSAAAQGACVLTGGCYDLTNTPPYGPWLDLVAGYTSGASPVSPPEAFAGGVLERVTDQAALFADVRRFLAELSANGPILAVIEDLHWADPASLDLLRHLGPRLRRLPILLLATYRVDDLTRRAPLYQQLPVLLREAEGLRLDLRRLDVSALRDLVATQYGLTPADETRLVAYLDRHAEGNPFFSTELLRALEEEGLLGHTKEGWKLGELERVVVPPFLRQVIEGRVARLGPDVREPLAVAAVIGHDVPVALWGEVSGLDDEALLAIVEQAIETHLLAAERDGVRVRFVHALTREALYEGVVPPRRRRLHQRVAEALIEDLTPNPDAVAYHLQQTSDARAETWLVKAADRAQQAYAWLTAADRLKAATDLLAEIPGKEDRRCRLLYRLARLKRFSLPREALAIADQAQVLTTRLGDPVLAGDILFTQGVVLCYANQFRAGLEALRASAEALEAMPLETARYYATSGPWLADVPPVTATGSVGDGAATSELLNAAVLRSRRAAYHWMGACANRPDSIIADGQRYLADLPAAETSVGLRFSTAYTHHALGVAHAAMARPDEARAAWRTARAIYAEFDHHALRALTVVAELRDVALTFGAVDAAARRALAAEAEHTIDRAGGAFRPGVSARLAWLGCLILDGRWEEADQILASLPPPGNAFLEREVTAATAELARHRGEPDIAWERIAASFPDGPATAPGDRINQEGLSLQRLAADLCLDAGNLAGALAWLSAHDRWLDWSGSILSQAAGRLGWARYHVVAEDHEGGHALATEVLGLAASPDQPLVRLAALRLLGEIETVNGNVAAAESALAAALALAERCEAPFEGAVTQLSLAALRLTEGGDREALLALDHVRQTCLPLGAAPTLSQAGRLASRLSGKTRDESTLAGLTAREAEVLRLLMARRTDKEIAEVLYLGPRTVQSHVASILGKLGVANRRAAAAEAERIGFV